MLFKVVLRKIVWWPVDVSVPLDDGKAEVQKIDAQFEIIEQSEADSLVYSQTGIKDLLERVVLGLRQHKKNAKDDDAPIGGENGEALSFDDAKRLMLEVVYIRAGLFAAYGKAANGQGRVKNS